MTVAIQAPTPDALRRKELAAFLRSRRERLSPEQVGLPAYGRRRTPGLRREEVAQLAGIGVTWYTWLEQGRRIKASVQVLDAVARTLMLDAGERSHLFTLAGTPIADAGSPCHAVRDSIRLLLRALPYPSAVSNARRDILAWNQMFEAIWGPIGALPVEERNVLWQLFTNPAWRAQMPDWEESAARLVAQFRCAMADHVGEPSWIALVGRLKAASPEFTQLWARHDVESPESQVKQIVHAEVGLLRLDHTHLWFGPAGSGTKLTTYTPADPDTAEKLRLLDKSVARPH
ncbi:MAG: helix-turn-helix transcriptional regulator [Micromonosporaceae bacterium]